MTTMSPNKQAIDQTIAKMVGATEVDLRDQQAIRTWADEVAFS